jgi:hypothetical protein
MQRFSRLVVAGVAASLFLALAPSAQADTQRAVSEPNGDVFVTSSSGAEVDSNHDKDNDFNTMTQADKGALFYSVFNGAAFAQTLHVTVTLDGPGTAQDATLVDEDVALGPACTGGICTDQTFDRFEFKVQRKGWPAGTYALSVTASGSETATAVSTFTVAYSK